jgi:hypothetical protein
MTGTQGVQMSASTNLAQTLEESEFGAAIVDDFLAPGEFTEIREHLVGHWAWRYKNWTNGYLHNYEIGTGALDAVAHRLSAPLSEAAGRPLRRVTQWAILAHADRGLIPHADNGTFVVNFWLTPDEYNLDPESGGMVLFDVRRPEMVMSPRFQITPDSDEYVLSRTRGGRLEVPYRCNRAIIFDATVFHASLPISFASHGAFSKRLNVSMVFDDPELFDARREQGLSDYGKAVQP